MRTATFRWSGDVLPVDLAVGADGRVGVRLVRLGPEREDRGSGWHMLDHAWEMEDRDLS